MEEVKMDDGRWMMQIMKPCRLAGLFLLNLFKE
jgi:hypothetical protein